MYIIAANLFSFENFYSTLDSSKKVSFKFLITPVKNGPIDLSITFLYKYILWIIII